MRTALLAVLLCSPVLAQQLQLDVVGGSIPGQIEMDLYPGSVGGGAAVLISTGPGPTAIPGDPAMRTMRLDLPLLPESQVGFFWTNNRYQPGPFNLGPALSVLYDQPFYFQGATFPGVNSPIDRISNLRVLWMGPQGRFRARGTWMVNPRAFFSVLPRTDGRWMATGGGTGALLAQVATDTTEIYDPATDTFVPGPLMQNERAVYTATELNDGRWLLVGGVDRNNDPQATCEIYDPAQDAFLPAAPMATPRMGHSATLLGNGKVLVAGGLSSLNAPNSPLDPIYSTRSSTEIYDPSTNTWSAGPNLTTPRGGHFVVGLPNGSVLLGGGVSYSSIFGFKVPAIRSSTDIYDPTTNTVSGAASMGTPRALTVAADLGGGRFLVAGGASDIAQSGAPTATAEIYDAASGSWTPTSQSMAQARALHTVVALGGGEFLHVGGGNGDLQNPGGLATTEIYDANNDTWSTGPSMSQARAGAGAFLTPTGTYHVIGGGGGSTGTVTSSSEWYYF